MKKLLMICVLPAAVLPALAHAATSPAEAYRAVMQAQLAAKKKPLPARPEEADAIYQNYLKSIGRPTKTSLDKANETPR